MIKELFLKIKNYYQLTIFNLMYSKKISILLSAACFPVLSFCKKDFTKELMMQSDNIIRYCMDYFDPGVGGKDLIWDFSNYFSNSQEKHFFVSQIEPDTIKVLEEDRKSVYVINDDSLLQMSYEDRLTKIHYNQSVLKMKFPSILTDSISKSFSGLGIYCADHYLSEEGNISVYSDAYGKIILSEKDTLESVRRIHSIKSYYVAMDADSNSLDMSKLKQVIEERYEWYAMDYCYPVIENVVSTSYSNLDYIGSTRYAYCNLPEDNKLLLNFNNRNNNGENGGEEPYKENYSDTSKNFQNIIDFRINKEGEIIHLNYDLKDNALISIMLCNSMAIVYQKKQVYNSSGEGYNMQINCSGLPRGQYVLYINVKGKIYSEKFNL